MGIYDKTPEKILVNTDFLKSAVKFDKSRNNTQKDFEKSKNMVFAMIGHFVSCVFTGFSWNSWGIIFKIFFIVISVAVIIIFVWNISQCIQARQKINSSGKTNLEEDIVGESKRRIRYTALLVISTQDKETGQVKLMTEKNDNFLIHCDMDPNKEINEQQESIKNYLATSYDVARNHIIEIVPFSTEPFYSIKPIHGEITQNGFVFFKIKLRKKAKNKLVNHRLSVWMTIQQMEDVPELMARNQDIIMALRENQTKISDSFEDLNGQIHVIWNITRRCPYSCAICATKDETREELSTDDKLNVLNHIYSAKDSISTLDFAGGDPMYNGGIRSVIMQAIHLLGSEHVSVTTTGRGIGAIKDVAEEEIEQLLKRCEITIDASHENLSDDYQNTIYSRLSAEYCRDNYSQIRNRSENISCLTINIPLINDDLNDDEIEKLISKLKKLKHDYSEIQFEAQIIRLMPVGALGDVNKEQYREYQPINVAKKIKTRIEGIGIVCRYHCSLRILPEIGVCDNRCSMLERKIGIDCSGNVFACTWGAYLQLPENSDVTQNPFYLGNLVTTDLKSILDGRATTTEAYRRISQEVRNHTNRPYCEAVSWFFSQETETNHDPLSLGKL